MTRAFPVLIDEPTLQGRIRELAAELAATGGPEPYLVAVLSGARPFAEAVCRHIGRTSGSYDTVKVASYGAGTTSSGLVRVDVGLQGNVSGKRVVLLEDIVDTGRTIRFLIDYVTERGAASVEVFTLLSKPSRRVCDVPLDYVGFEIPDEFVIGFGMDLAGSYRELPYIGIWSEQAAAADA